MKKIDYRQVTSDKVEEEGAQGVSIRWVISDKDGAANFAMRVFTVEPEGFTPHHQHDWEHEVFILKGEGVVLEGDTPNPVVYGDVIFIPPDEWHQFKNTGANDLEFICLIPYKNKCSCC